MDRMGESVVDTTTGTAPPAADEQYMKETRPASDAPFVPDKVSLKERLLCYRDAVKTQSKNAKSFGLHDPGFNSEPESYQNLVRSANFWADRAKSQEELAVVKEELLALQELGADRWMKHPEAAEAPVEESWPLSKEALEGRESEIRALKTLAEGAAMDVLSHEKKKALQGLAESHTGGSSYDADKEEALEKLAEKHPILDRLAHTRTAKTLAIRPKATMPTTAKAASRVLKVAENYRAPCGLPPTPPPGLAPRGPHLDPSADEGPSLAPNPNLVEGIVSPGTPGFDLRGQFSPRLEVVILTYSTTIQMRAHILGIKHLIDIAGFSEK